MLDLLVNIVLEASQLMQTEDFSISQKGGGQSEGQVWLNLVKRLINSISPFWFVSSLVIWITLQRYIIFNKQPRNGKSFWKKTINLLTWHASNPVHIGVWGMLNVCSTIIVHLSDPLKKLNDFPLTTFYYFISSLKSH